MKKIFYSFIVLVLCAISQNVSAQTCCQSHGSHNHLSRMVLKYVGPASPANITFSSSYNSVNLNYSATHQLNDTILLQNPGNNAFATNVNFNVGGNSFSAHVSCSTPINIGYGIKNNGNIVSNPNPNASDILFIIIGLATPDGCEGGLTCTANITGLKINDLVGNNDVTITNNGTYSYSTLPSSFNLESIVTGSVGSMKFEVSGGASGSTIENAAPYNYPGTSSAWAHGAGTYTVISKAYKLSGATGELCDIDTVTFTLTPPNCCVELPMIKWDMDACLSCSGNSNVFTEFTGTTSVCFPGTAYNLSATSNHSCVAGANSSAKALCISSGNTFTLKADINASSRRSFFS